MPFQYTFCGIFQIILAVLWNVPEDLQNNSTLGSVTPYKDNNL